MNPEATPIPTLSSAQVAELDRLVASRFALSVEWLMDAAGWQAARHCRGNTAVLCGRGSKGGDGLAAARHLHPRGGLHSVAAVDRRALPGAAAGVGNPPQAARAAIEDPPRLGGS